MIKKSCEIPLTTKYRPFWPLSSSHLVRNLVRGLISSPNPRSLGENVSSRNPRNIVRSRKVSRCSLPAELGIWISDGSGACLAARLTNHSTAFNRQCTGRTITEPLQTSDRDNILHSMERFSEKVFDCQVCRYVNRAENRWHCVQEADLVWVTQSARSRHVLPGDTNLLQTEPNSWMPYVEVKQMKINVDKSNVMLFNISWFHAWTISW